MLASILLCLTLTPAQPLPSGDKIRTSSVWEQTGVIAAPEAHQAAAADETFAYAISSTQIAKYDRKTGKRVAVSRGAAKHLNSGFIWNGKLYSAHSNYPKKPEQSEIKVLDVESMELSTFKDFGSYGGSLTWVVWHADCWWCNFAHYGADNARTFLVRFDDQWRELGRWTYPPEVLAGLGRMSISGGLWRQDSLLVTDHDHRILYRLQLPTSTETTLKFLEKQPAPFTGQGIAADPATGGLVGIDRSKRTILFAE